MSQVIIHPPGLDSFFEHVPKAMLPKDYGGEEASLRELSGTFQNAAHGQNSGHVSTSRVVK